MGCLDSPDPVVRMRAAGALAKLSVPRLDGITPHADRILRAAADHDQQGIDWHAAQILPRLAVAEAQRAVAVELCFALLANPSRTVQADALTALVAFTCQVTTLAARVMPALTRALTSPTPSLAARARRLRRSGVPPRHAVGTRSPPAPADCDRAGRVADEVGFEPTEGCPSLVFKTSALNRSATHPLRAGGWARARPP